MSSNRLLLTCLVGLPLLVGCASSQPEPKPAPVVQPEPVNQEVLNALSDLSEIKQELKKLRNSVEELQFESENAKRRQQDLFQDLDRRLVDIERNQTALNPGEQVVDGSQTEAGQTGVVVVGDTATQSGQNDDQAETDNQTANQVIVVSSANQSAATSSQGQTATVATTATGSVTLEEQEAYEQAFELLKQSRYEDAVASFQQFADTWPNSQLADDAYYWMSEARYVNREFEEALRGFRTVVSRYPDSQRVPEALLKIGYIQYDIGSYEDAAGTFRDILDRFPGHQVTVSAQTRLRRIEQTIQ